MPLYGWFLKHSRSGQYIRVDDCTVTPDLKRATRFDTRAEAIEAAATASQLPMMQGIQFAIVDATIHDAPTPDADTAPIPTRDEILKAAHEAGEDRRVKHAAARAVLRSQPSGVLLPHPNAGGK